MGHVWVYQEDASEVVIKMDVATAEKLLAVISGVRDDTTTHPEFNTWDDLVNDLEEKTNVRYPSPLYAVNVYGHPMNKVWNITYKEKR